MALRAELYQSAGDARNVAAYQLGSPQSPRYERTTRLDADGRVIFQQQPGPPRPALVSDLNNPAAQAPMPAKKS